MLIKNTYPVHEGNATLKIVVVTKGTPSEKNSIWLIKNNNESGKGLEQETCINSTSANLDLLKIQAIAHMGPNTLLRSPS